jgi:putative transposase
VPRQGHRDTVSSPGSPTQNAYIESFNNTFCDECLDENCLESLEQTRQSIATWRTDYKEIRPHSSSGHMPPTKFAAMSRQLTGDSTQQSKPDAGIIQPNNLRISGT